MEIQELWRILSERWRVVAITTLACVALSLCWSLAGPVSYTAQGRVTISTAGSLGTAGDAYSGEQVSVQRAPTYAQLLNGPEVAARASTKLNGEISAQTIQDSVKAQITARLPMIVVTATARSANDAVRMVAAVGQSLQDYVKEIERPGRDGSLTAVVLTGDAPVVSQNIHPVRYAALSAIAGLLLGILLATFRDRTDPIVKSAGQVAGQGFVYRGTVVADATGPEVDQTLRRIAMELLVSKPGGGSRLLVAGVDADCYTAFVARRLGRALVACGRSATVVDGVGRGRANLSPGLSDVLAGSVSWRECARKSPSGTSLMGAGTLSTPVDVLIVDSEDPKGRFPVAGPDEYVVIAAPSIVHSPVAVALTAVTDAILVVVRQGASRIADVEEAKRAVDALGITPLGLVLVVGVPRVTATPAARPDEKRDDRAAADPVPETTAADPGPDREAVDRRSADTARIPTSTT